MQVYIDRYFFYLFLFTFIFGVMLYNIIGFDYMDEFCALFLFILFSFFMLKTKNWEMNRAFLITLFIFLFYLCYSLYIQSNTKAGILNDLLIQIKPYLGFFCVYSMKPRMDTNQKSILKSVSIIFWFLLLLLGICSLFIHRLMYIVLEHPAYYAETVIIVAFCYLYCSKFTLMDRIKFLLMLSIGILSGRSKFYGFYALSVFVILLFPHIKVLKWNFKNMAVVLLMLAAILLVAWQKIDYYFYQAITGEVDKDMVARFVLYATMPLILIDYFPFGSGLASFATYSSGQFYSPIYNKYGIDGVWGITKSNYPFIADTYYPSLAQFGVAGILLYILFWIYIFKKAYTAYINGKNRNYLFHIIIMIIGYLAINGVADPTFITYRGFFVMILLGLILVEMQNKEKIIDC